MVKINTAGHAAPGATSGWEWLAYTNKKQLATVKAAVSILETSIKDHKPCNAAFKLLPGGRTFKDVLADAAIWISRDPGTTPKRFGATLGNEITVTAWSLAMGRWTVAATLVHELAHVNGAGGADSAAEDTLKSCLLTGHHNPAIIGDLIYPKPGSKLTTEKLA